MMNNEGYSIQEYPKLNKLVIYLPQTMKTCTNTVREIGERKDALSDIEQLIILNIVKSIYQGLYDD